MENSIREKYINSGKKLTEIYLQTEKKSSPKIVEGINEVVIVFSICEEKEKSANNKTSDERVELINRLLNEGHNVKDIAELIGTSRQNIYNHKAKENTDEN